MKFNFRKVVPVITGALLLGSTLGFATSVAGADVTYPSSFADSVVVIGSASADSAAANSLAADLGKLTVSGSTSVSDGHLVAKGSNVLNYNDDFNAIDSKLDDGDLAELLADGTYKDTKGTNDNEEDYEQSLRFVSGGNTLVFEADEDNNDMRAAYLKLTDGTVAFNYSLKFTTGPKYDNSTATLLKDDFQLTKLNILGDDWTIIDASQSSAAGPTKLTLMGGATATTMKSGESRTLTLDGKSYDIEVTVYSDKAQFVINGEALNVDESGTDELADGTEIGVTEISTSSKETVPDQVEFFLGARKLVLENGQEVTLNGDDIDGSLVTITNDVINDRLKEIIITFTPDDDVWIAEGRSWEDPVFGKFKLVFASLNKVGAETIEVSTGSDTGWLKFLNSAGEELKIDFWDNESDVFLGKKFTRGNVSAGGRVGLQSHTGNLLFANGDYCTAAKVERCEGIEFLAVDSDGKARIFEMTDINVGDMKVKFKDLTTGSVYERDFTNGTTMSLDIGLIGDLGIHINQTFNLSSLAEYNSASDISGGYVNFSFNNYAGNGAVGGMETSLEGALLLTRQGPDMQIALHNETGQIRAFNLSLEAASPFDMQIHDLAGVSEEESGADYYVGIDAVNYGAWFRYDNEDKNDLEIVYPGDEPVWADTYVSPIGAVVSGGGIVPVLRDNELGTYKTSKDLVVVGGPAVNELAAELLGVDFPTYGDESEMFSADAAMIKLFEGTLTPGKVALLVAGYEAKDTSAAAKALIADNKFGDLTTTTASTYSFA